MKYGCLARLFNDFDSEVRLAKENGFEIVQLWYDKNGLVITPQTKNIVEFISNQNIETIIHAVLNYNELLDHIVALKQLAYDLKQTRIIIHPTCPEKHFNEYTKEVLVANLQYAVNAFLEDDIVVYIENNSQADLIFNDISDFKYVFDHVTHLEFLLDLSHLNNLDQLSEILTIKYPKLLHVSDRRKTFIHEHLPLGSGDIDYKAIFNNELKDYNGDIILEIIKSDESLIASKTLLKEILDHR